MASKGLHAGLEGWWGLLGAERPPEGLSMSCLEPLHAIDITAVILRGNFLIGHPVYKLLALIFPLSFSES